MATVAVGLARMIEDFGLDSIFVQDKSIQGEQQARLAGFIIFVGIALCLCYVLLAGPIASFFGEPRVAWAVTGFSVLLLTDSLQVVPRAMLQRDLAFGRLALLAFLQVLVTQVVLVVAAKAGWGFKSLVVNALASAFFSTALLILWRPYAVMWPRELASLAKPLLQGWRMLASRLAYYTYSNVDQTLIGRLLGKDALGAYSFATSLSTTAMQEVGAVVTKVVPGIFSASQNNRSDLRRYFLLLTELVAYLTMPLSIGLALTADMVVALVLGPQWHAVAAPLRILCAFTAFSNAQLLISHLMVWTGQFRAQMWCTFVTAIALPIGFLVAVDHGLEGIALVWAVVYPISNIPAVIVGLRTIETTSRQWFVALAPALSACAIMAGAVICARVYLPQEMTPALRCGLSILTGAFVYCLTLFICFGTRLRGIVSIVRATKISRPLPSNSAPNVL